MKDIKVMILGRNLQLSTSTSAQQSNYLLKPTNYHRHRKIAGKPCKRNEALWIDWKSSSNSADITPFRFTGKERDEETGLYYFGARYLDPRTSRWMSADPAMYQGDYIPGAPINDEARKRNGNLPNGGIYNYINLHTFNYSNNNPVKYTDTDGRAPGDPFDTADEAAWDALAYINNKSMDENVEYSGAIYQKPEDSKYYATEPETLRILNRSRVVFGPEGTMTVGQYHTHSNYTRMDSYGTITNVGEPYIGSFDNDNFAPLDKALAVHHGVIAYLGTPSGIFKKYNNVTDRESILGVAIIHKQQSLSTFFSTTNFPSQSNHTLRHRVKVSR